MNSYEPNSAIVVLYRSDEFTAIDKKLSGHLQSICDAQGFENNDDAEVDVSYPTKINVAHITIVKSSAKEPKEWRDFGGTYFSKYNGKVDNLYFDIDGDDNEQIYEGAKLAAYTFTKYKTKTADFTPLTVHINIDDQHEDIIHESVYFARDLVSEPGNVLFPAEYAKRINDTLTPLGVTVKVYHEAQLKDMGFDLLLSVGQGSTKDSYVVVMEYMNGGDEQPVALVGKGVCFDTGGISLKPSAGMGDMKYDMGGSAAVVGAMHAIADKELQHNVVGIVGLVENMPDGNAIKPGDVVKSLSGLIVENLNTDAEGRLVLADILTHVQNEYEPSVIIDLATLTGAIVVSLANEMAGLFTNSSELSNTIDAIGSSSGEGFWRMPMGKNWNKMIDSDIADVKNIGGGKGGGSTTAAEFLYRFVDKNIPWAHLDIAGMAWETGGKPVTPKGAVGFGVRTLYEFVATEAGRVYTIDEDMKY